ncbi:MAG: hypothetical protein JXA46_18860 [Dehalococcoidales bacterium]|nr:hypothetical protein [Dehalococcoidales bacterium]
MLFVTGYFCRFLLVLALIAISFTIIMAGDARADPAGVTVQRYYAVWEDEWTTISTDYVDIEPGTGYYPLKLTFTPPDDADYLVIACFTVSNTSTTTSTSVQILYNSVQVYYRTWIPTAAGDHVTAGFADVYSLTGGTPCTFQMQLNTGGTSGTAMIRDASIMVFKVSSYYYSSDYNTHNFNSGTYQDGLSLSIPSAAVGDYLVLASTSVSSAMTSKSLYCNWQRGSTSQAEIVRYFSKSGEYRGWLTMRVMTFNSAAETLKLQYRVQTPNTCIVHSQRMVAVKLIDLGIDSHRVESETASGTSSTTYQTKITATVTPSPAKQGDYLVMGFAMLNGSSTKAGEGAYARLDIDGVYQAERSFRPEDTTDYIPLYAFKKYRMLSGSHTVKIEYRPGSASSTATIKNARILAIKVNTLQSYGDAAVTPRTVFDADHPAISIYGYACEYRWYPAPGAPMPYKVAYYDGGTGHDGIDGDVVYIDNISSGYNRSISSTLTFSSVPASSYGAWHAVVYRADAGDPAPPGTYVADDPDSVMEIEFTVEQDALYSLPPDVTFVKLFDSDRSAEATTMIPRVEYAVRLTVSNPVALSTLSSVQAAIFYDTDGVFAPEDVPASGDTQTAAILTCIVGDTPSWSIDPSADSTWSIFPENCQQPALTETEGDFWFHFEAGKVATATTGDARWHIYAQATGAGGSGDNYQDGLEMNWYGEITVDTPSVDFGSVEIGSDFSDNQQNGISVTYICNGDYSQQVKVSPEWTGGGNSVFLDPAGSPGEGEFSLKANNSVNLSSAELVPDFYVAIGSGTQTDEPGNTESANTLWLKLGVSGLPAVTYNGTIYYGITQ